MKKIFTLLLLTGIASLSFAQSGRVYGPRPNNGRVIVRTSVSGPSYSFTSREKDKAIKKIHRQYARKIHQVNNRAFTSRLKKMQMTSQLERERDIAIGKVNARFYNARNRAYHQRDYNRRRY